jgi:acyl dehydratase
MSPLPSKPRGLYFEEFEPGQEILTAGRTVTETDIVHFAGLSGDFTQIHVDVEYSRKTMIGQRIAHGLLIASIASGLAVQTGVLEGTVIVFREIAEWKFIKPVFIGDTIQGVLRVKETKEMRRAGGGLVTIDFEVKNQREEVVNRGVWIVLVAGRPA